jgi:hypothetical protein
VVERQHRDERPVGWQGGHEERVGQKLGLPGQNGGWGVREQVGSSSQEKTRMVVVAH